MPKVSIPTLPLSGLFGIVKPSGPTSMSVLTDIKKLAGKSRIFVEADKLGKPDQSKKHSRKRSRFDSVKIGQGGTLDPLADGVLVIGVGRGTKHLNQFLDCTKEYYTTCLLGCETDTYDNEGKRVRLAPWHHVTREKVEAALPKFTGEISQTPPIFSALKMDGRPLYEYARKGIPLPRPIEPRKVTVHSLELVEWKGADHTYEWPQDALDADEKKAMETALKSVESEISLKDDPETPDKGEKPPTFVLKMEVSGGTYVRSIVHDLAHHLNSAGHVVTLTRSRQGKFVMDKPTEGDVSCVPWEVFQRASENSSGETDEDGWTEWEREVLDRLEIIDK
ncbi:pseudouridine synthase [Macrolepiota fuliginosa MF-IS2]|uniref:tRNA pseudouridine(55) synthase n=1 Tax=Macrolepiota fuliginosa MF-IS2 TaxID=1400762 RepID=A0A9P5XPJ3_9AGAR|nr:pseudouridine synthase [Macrolepiota fuliginosa MF-IS2]